MVWQRIGERAQLSQSRTGCAAIAWTAHCVRLRSGSLPLNSADKITVLTSILIVLMKLKNFVNSRLLLVLLTAWGALIFWMAPHPPMVDFPQHAAQISLLSDLIAGRSPWSAQMQINLLTPYLVGYGLASLLSFVMPVVAAMKLLLSLAYISFVAVGIAFRKRVSADSRLDWIFVPTFFGFCYAWGMYTFLLAAPIGLFFILQADRYASGQTVRRGAVLTLTGLVLLISHGMTFVFGWGVGVLLLALKVPRRWKSITLFLPYLILLVAGVFFYKSGKQLDATIIHNPLPLIYGSGLLMRLKEAAQFPFSFEMKMGSDKSLLPVILAIMIAPFLLGLRVNWRRTASWVPFFCVCLLFFVLPNQADNTSLLYSRYSLFLLPTYVWLFSAESGTKDVASKPNIVRSRFSQAILVAACIFVLGSTSLNAWRFGKETQEFDTQVSKLAGGGRALGLIFDPGSAAAKSWVVYIHYPAWYQAGKQGLTDFNFAWFTPQVVRYRPGASPAVAIGFEWKPGNFDWVKHQGASYRYFFVRGKHSASMVFRDAPCQPKVAIDTEMWKVYENCSFSENKSRPAIEAATEKTPVVPALAPQVIPVISGLTAHE
jgi:hypothetical protein